MNFTSEELDIVRDALMTLHGKAYNRADDDYCDAIDKLMVKIGRGNMPEEIDLAKWMTETNDLLGDEVAGMNVGDMIDRDWHAVAERCTPREFVDELKERIEDGDYSGIWD